MKHFTALFTKPATDPFYDLRLVQFQWDGKSSLGAVHTELLAIAMQKKGKNPLWVMTAIYTTGWFSSRHLFQFQRLEVTLFGGI